MLCSKATVACVTGILMHHVNCRRTVPDLLAIDMDGQSESKLSGVTLRDWFQCVLVFERECKRVHVSNH